MYETQDFHIKGVVPLLTRNSQLADPLHPTTQEIKKITAKRTKSEADYRAVEALEWMGALYLNEDSKPCIPGENLEGLVWEGAKKKSRGQLVRSGVVCDGVFEIIHDGPENLDDLAEDPRFRDRRSVVIQKKRIMRVRPIFRIWELKFTVHFMEDILERGHLIEAVQDAGRLVGLGDYKPRYGRFVIV